MAVLNTVASLIVYTPLILIGLTVLYGIGYGVWYYKYRDGADYSFPPSYVSAGATFLRVLKTILTPLKWLGQFLWWLIPIDRSWFGYPSWRASLGYIEGGAWASVNRARSLTILALITICATIAITYTYGYPANIMGYSYFLNGTLLVLLILAVLALFVSFNRKIMTEGFPGNPWPTGGEADTLPERRRNWAASATGSYLYYSIAVGLALGILFTLFYLLVNYGMFNLTGSFIIMMVTGLAALFMIYKAFSSNPTVREGLRKSAFLNNLFYIVFIIPCLFGDTVKYLFNHLRHTPRMAYILLGIEMLAIGSYVLIPILQRYFYTLMPPKDNKQAILISKINSLKKNKIIIRERIKRIKDFSIPINDSNGNLVTISRKLDNEGWKNIISRGYNSKKNESDLTNYLLNYGFTDPAMCKADNGDKGCQDIFAAIKYIQKYTVELVGLEVKLEESDESIKTLEEEMKRARDLQKSSVLLRDPVYLKNKKYITNFEEQRRDKFDIEYNYNYALSGWFFFRANSLKTIVQQDNFKSILNYGNKPNILFNSIENKLKIVMNNGKNQKPKIYMIEDVPLQKWVNIVVNYDSGVLDIFMDSKLLASFNNIVPYMSQDQITIGDIKGVSGGVCNVVYFPQSISKERIELNYKILSNKNPPIV